MTAGKPPQQHAAFDATADPAAAAAVPSVMAQRAANARSGFVHHFITKWCDDTAAQAHANLFTCSDCGAKTCLATSSSAS